MDFLRRASIVCIRTNPFPGHWWPSIDPRQTHSCVSCSQKSQGSTCQILLVGLSTISLCSVKLCRLRQDSKDFGKGQAKQDPVVHFYETFLAAYDPALREVRGVYYTPEPVVGYIVRSVGHLLKHHFDKPKGLADEKTLVLDPAVGTATFLFSVIQHIYAGFQKQKGAWDGYVSEHLLSRIFGSKLLMAPYAVAHLKLGMELEETGYQFKSEQRLGIYLTNTLEEAARKSEKVFARWISDEANAAAEIKRDLKITVVLVIRRTPVNQPIEAKMKRGS